MKVRLTDRLALVASGRRGFDLTDSLDCHVYLVDGGGECALIDAGAGRDPDATLREIRRDGFDLSRIHYLILTHPHADHAGGAFALKQRLGLQVLCHPHAADILERGDEAAVHLPAARACGLFPQDIALPACPVDRRVGEGDRIRVGELELRVLDTPGHCRGHLSLYFELGGRPHLFCGDLVFHGGRILAQSIPDCDLQEYAASVLRLAELPVEVFLPGHGLFSLADGKRHIDEAAAVFRRLGVPPNL